jgi:hypothetical protein
MNVGPKQAEQRVEQPLRAWELQCPGQAFGEVTLEQHRAALEPYFAAKAKFAAIDAQWSAARLERNAAYEKALEITKQVVDSVKGHPKYGENSSLYQAMGYVPKSERASGLTRRREAQATKAPEPEAS